MVIFEKNRKGTAGFTVPSWDIDEWDDIPEIYLADSLELLEVSEVDVVRHYTRLSRMNFGVDSGMYPLGSCTMKYNPKINEKIAQLDGFLNCHPLSGDRLSQGCLEILYLLNEYLCEITGFDRFTLSPAAGAHGELTGVMIIKKHFEKIGEERTHIIIPDSAHGTNPASVSMCGFEVREVPSKDGDVDIEHLADMVDERTAAMMLTSPNTFGLFDRNSIEIADILHRKGALFYCDGANLNALMGKARITDMGFDMMHINLHKTFSTPHGGGGPGAGPLGVVDSLKGYLPVPLIGKDDRGYFLDENLPDSIGRMHSFYGNFLVILKAFAYIRTLGPAGIVAVAENAVLNANYLLARLKNDFHLPIDRLCMHEFVISDRNFPNGITTNDIAKRILDYGFHAPTVYFPLTVQGAMMIEPTETESKEELDRFVETMQQIKREAIEEPDTVKRAPHRTPVRRVDAVLASRKPTLIWEEDKDKSPTG